MPVGTVLWLLGVALLVAIVVDVFATVVRPDGSGFLATVVSRTVWRVALGVHRRRRSHGLLATGGVVAVVLMPIAWMFLMWAGWTLVFNGSPDAVLDGRTRVPADGWERVYFAGFSLFTSGLGDLVPGGPPWEVATVLASAMGLGLVTLAITFLVPVIQAATDRRAVARTIHHLGASPWEIVERYEPSAFRGLVVQVADLPAALTKLAIQHHSYPVLGHLHSPDVRQALMPQLAILYDACLVAAPEADDVERVQLEAVVESIDFLTRSLSPDGDGERTVATGDWPPDRAQHLPRESPTRARLRSLVEADGWSWDADVLAIGRDP